MFKYKTNFTLEDNSSDYLKISWAGESFQSQFVIFMENLSSQNNKKKEKKKNKKPTNLACVTIQACNEPIQSFSHLA